MPFASHELGSQYVLRNRKTTIRPSGQSHAPVLNGLYIFVGETRQQAIAGCDHLITELVVHSSSRFTLFAVPRPSQLVSLI